MTISWTSAFAYSYFSLPLLFSFSYIFTSFTNSFCRFDLRVFKFVLVPFIFTSFYYILVAIINPHIKVINYTLVYIFLPLLFCYLPLLIKINKDKVKNIEDYFIYSLLFIALLCILESIVRFYFGFDITSLVPQLKGNEAYTLTSSGEVLNRSRGLSSEPMIVGLYLCVGLQHILIKLKNTFLSGSKGYGRKTLIYLGYSFIFIFAILTTGSASSFIISFFGFLLLLSEVIYKFVFDLNNRKINLNILKIFLCVIFLICGFLFILEIIPAYKVAVENIIGKISLDKDFTSVRQRLLIFKQYFDYFISDPLGLKGSLGFYSSKTSAINWYMTLLGDVGIIGTFFTLMPISTSILLVINSPYKNNFSRFDKLFLIVIPLFGLLFHGTFYASPLWATILLTYYL